MKRSKKMLSRFTSFVHNAVEALAPEMTNLEQFRYHWKSVTQFFLDTSDERMSVENTTIPHHIEQMLFVLLQEEKENGTNSHGPSMEFMLQHKILETMQTLGRADCPPGMKRQVLVFFTNLLGKSKQQLLPHVNAHKPVNKLIRCCGEVKAAPTEAEEVAFLLQVSSKLKQDSYLVNFFLEKPSSSEGGSTSPLTLGMERERERPEYSLVDSLLALTRSEDSRVAIKACEGLILVTSIPEDNAASVIVLYTPFCERMADQLSKLFKSLPAVIDPHEMNQLSATWGFDHSDENMSSFVGKRQMIAFFSWLDYVNQLSVEAHPMVSKALAFAIRERYILTAIEPGLSQASEPCSITVTALLTRCLKLVTSPLLAQEFAAILLGTDEEEEEEEEEEGEEEAEEEEKEGKEKKGTHKIRELLIQRINHISDQMAVETLRLFQALLQLPYQPIIDVLVTSHFKVRNFINFDRAKLVEEMTELSMHAGLKSSSLSNIGEEEKTKRNVVDGELLNELENESNNDIGILSSEKVQNSSSSCIDEKNNENSSNNNESALNDVNEETVYHTASETMITHTLDETNNDKLVEAADVEKTEECDDDEQKKDNNKNIPCDNKDTNINENVENLELTPANKCVPFEEPEQLSIKKQQELYLSRENSQNEDQENTSIDITEEDKELCKLIDSIDDSDDVLKSMDDSDDILKCKETFSKKRIEKVVNGFLLIFPEVLRTSEMVGDVGYDSYLRDAHKQCQERALQSFQYNWPICSSSDENETNNEPFYEGDFLQSILKRLQMILDQPFHINLEVTAIVSLLCQFQHPYLHEFLMDTADIVKENILTPHRILSKVCQDMKMRASRIPSCQALLLSMRKNLNASTSGELNSIPEESFFQAIIILEEFCKELAAIAFVTATQNENS